MGLGRRGKPIFVDGIQKIGLQTEEDKVHSNIHSSTSIRRVAELVDEPHSTVQNNMWSILRYQ